MLTKLTLVYLQVPMLFDLTRKDPGTMYPAQSIQSTNEGIQYRNLISLGLLTQMAIREPPYISLQLWPNDFHGSSPPFHSCTQHGVIKGPRWKAVDGTCIYDIFTLCFFRLAIQFIQRHKVPSLNTRIPIWCIPILLSCNLWALLLDYFHHLSSSQPLSCSFGVAGAIR